MLLEAKTALSERDHRLSRARSIFGERGELLEERFRRACCGWDILNVTDFQESNCFSFEILLHAHLSWRPASRETTISMIGDAGGEMQVWHVDVSAVSPFFDEYFKRRTWDAERGIVLTERLRRNQCQSEDKYRNVHLTLQEYGKIPASIDGLCLQIDGFTKPGETEGKLTCYRVLFHENRDVPCPSDGIERWEA